MPETRVPGIAAKRVVITDDCRSIHSDGGAFNRAALQLLAEYGEITSRRGNEKGVNYHLVLTVEDTKRDPAKRPTAILRKPRGGHMASMPEPRPPVPPNPRETT